MDDEYDGGYDGKCDEDDEDDAFVSNTIDFDDTTAVLLPLPFLLPLASTFSSSLL